MASVYSSVSLADLEPTGAEPGYQDLTPALGCSDTRVEGYRIPAEHEITLAAEDEQVVVPLNADQPLELGNDHGLPHPGVACVPAEIPSTLRTPTDCLLAVISTTPEPSTDSRIIVVDLAQTEFKQPETSTILTARLTAPLECHGVKVNARLLQPGQHVPYHTEGTQEELFIPVRGPSAMRIDDTTHDTPVGTVTRVAPPVPRSAVNPGTVDGLWVMVGAPPTGGPDDWDPGATTLE